MLQTAQAKHFTKTGFRCYMWDFGFLSRYITQFQGKLDIAISDELVVYYKGQCIMRFSVGVAEERFRMYRLKFFLAFSSIKSDEFVSGEQLFSEVAVGQDGSCSVLIGPELLHWWFHRLIWEAVHVLNYQELH